MTSRDLFRTIVDDLASKAKATLPDSAGRIDAAVALVLAGDVALQPDGTAIVGSANKPMTTYSVNRTCACPDFARAPQSWCKHRIARAVFLRTERALHDTHDAEASSGVLEGCTEAEKAAKEKTRGGGGGVRDPRHNLARCRGPKRGIHSNRAA